jgi:hypothetical protein
MAATDFATAAGHPFSARLNRLLRIREVLTGIDGALVDFPFHRGCPLKPSRCRSTGVFAFGDFELDCRSRELRKGGRANLVAAGGEIVTRAELRDAVWGEDTHVDFDGGINKGVNRLRDGFWPISQRVPRSFAASPIECALVSLGLGDADTALKGLAQAYSARAPRLTTINAPFFSAVPRFEYSDVSLIPGRLRGPLLGRRPVRRPGRPNGVSTSCLALTGVT